ncbi:hypothetical protein BCR33DRAFT_716519 [Rhizoclosmatium globosum]|uniref:DUF659 domain-containing protein n=1 Tax=Rhizoclosmatium globosum TaxID=329046 RepID=A0A1Y2BR65_9FUNG|nr:hypothetical protein BCR33DRAFT_721863 [Rhizoclosmatium globosum]ORY45203.1 hypothetical protein BCR33DRAFT_716519 [Rhizoclosmatium globosum]|eukprot:ORY36635.1 hypothetical protein BCR33DRAFT_721863 [Rhizoclosmatium globosum]
MIDFQTFNIANYLDKLDQTMNQSVKPKGSCKVCGHDVYWSRERVISHKRSSHCKGQTANDLAMWSESLQKRQSRAPFTAIQINNNNQSPPAFNNGSGSSTSLSNKRSRENDQAEDGAVGPRVITVNPKLCDDLNTAIARWAYACAIPFIAFGHSFWKAIWDIALPSFKSFLQTPAVIGSTSLKREYDYLKSQEKKLMNDSKLKCLVTDGWSNCRGEHIVNFVWTIFRKPPLFRRSKDCSGISQSADAIFEEIEKV